MWILTELLPQPRHLLVSWFPFCCCEPFHGQSNLGGTGWYPLTAHSPWWKEVRQELKPENRSLELKRAWENAKEILHGSCSVPFYSAQTTGTRPCHIDRLSLKCPPQHCALDSLMEPSSDWHSLFPNDSVPVRLTTLSSTLLCPFSDTLPAFFWIFPPVSVVLMRGSYCNASRGSCYHSGVRSLWEISYCVTPSWTVEVVVSLIKITKGTAWCSGFGPILFISTVGFQKLPNNSTDLRKTANVIKNKNYFHRCNNALSLFIIGNWRVEEFAGNFTDSVCKPGKF